MNRIVLVFLMMLLVFPSLIRADLENITLKRFLYLMSKNFNKTVLIDKELNYNLTLINTKNINELNYFGMVITILDSNGLVIINKDKFYYIKKKDIHNSIIKIPFLKIEKIQTIAKLYDVNIIQYKDNDYIATYTSKQKYKLFSNLCKKLTDTSTINISCDIYRLNDGLLKENDIDVNLVLNVLNKKASRKAESLKVDMSNEGFIGFGVVGETFNISGFIKFLEKNNYLKSVVKPNFLTISSMSSNFKNGYMYRKEVSSTSNLDVVNPLVTKTFQDDNIGLDITVKPTLLNKNSIKLDLHILDSSLVSIDTNNNSVKSTFNYKSSFIINNDEELIIAGITTKKVVKNISKVPILGDIWGLGYFFKEEFNDVSNNTLVIKIKATILKNKVREEIKKNMNFFREIKKSDTH